MKARWYAESGYDDYSYDSLNRVTSKSSKVIGLTNTNQTFYAYEGGTSLIKNLDILLNGSSERHNVILNGLNRCRVKI